MNTVQSACGVAELRELVPAIDVTLLTLGGAARRLLS